MWNADRAAPGAGEKDGAPLRIRLGSESHSACRSQTSLPSRLNRVKKTKRVVAGTWWVASCSDRGILMISACACGGGSSRAVALSEWVKPTCGRDTVRRATCRRAGNTPGSCSVFWTLLMVVLKPRRDRLTPILCSRSFFGRLRSSLRCSLSYSALPAVSIAVKSSRCWAPFPRAKALGGRRSGVGLPV